MKGRLIAAAFSLCGLVCTTASGARAGDDPRAAAEAIVFGSAATQAAYARWGDDALRGERQRIDALSMAAKSEDRRAGRDLVGAEAAFDDALAARDHGYARAMTILRAAMTGLAATPAGRAALSRFAGGDESGALAALDTVQAALDKARVKPLAVEIVARSRWIAAIAWDARQRGKLTTDQLIGRYEALVRVDPLGADDWIRLHDLYRDAGRISDAYRAIETAMKVAVNDPDLGLTLGVFGRELLAGGDLDGASQAMARGLPVFRRLAVADPADEDRAWNLALALLFRGYDLALRRDRAGARSGLWNPARASSPAIRLRSHRSDGGAGAGGDAADRRGVPDSAGRSRRGARRSDRKPVDRPAFGVRPSERIGDRPDDRRRRPVGPRRPVEPPGRSVGRAESLWREPRPLPPRRRDRALGERGSGRSGGDPGKDRPL